MFYDPKIRCLLRIKDSMNKSKIALLTVVAMTAFAANSLLCRMALRGARIDAASFTLNVWHYSLAQSAPAIFASRKLKPGTTGGLYSAPLLWFTADQDWSPLIAHEGSDYEADIRFGLPATDSRLIPWSIACALCGTENTRTANHVSATFAHVIARRKWFASREAISLTSLHFEVLRDGRWCPEGADRSEHGRTAANPWGELLSPDPGRNAIRAAGAQALAWINSHR